jgi:hypothetical protein
MVIIGFCLGTKKKGKGAYAYKNQIDRSIALWLRKKGREQKIIELTDR